MTGTESRSWRIRRIGQIALGAIWLIDGALQFQPALFSRALITDVILPNAAGQPGIVASPLTWIGHQIEPHVALFNALAATLQVMIGLGLVYRRTVKPALAVSFLWAAAIWFAGEGFGGILTGTANPLTGAPGAALLYIVVGLIVWPRPAGGERGARFAWAGLWLSWAALWLLPASDGSGSVHDAIASAPSGTGWLTGLLHATANATTGRGTAIAIAMAALSAAIAVSILTRTAQRTFLGVAIALSLVFWVVGQGVGGIFAGGATDVSTAPLVILMGSILLAQTRLPRREAQVSFAMASPASSSAAA
jgi:hypothetical protein